jgi:hypothetical protein
LVPVSAPIIGESFPPAATLTLTDNGPFREVI